MTTLEKMARAILAKVLEGYGMRHAEAKDYARAATEAMMEPSSEMGMAGYKAWDSFGEDAVMGPEELIAVWQAMLRHILEEKD